MAVQGYWVVCEDIHAGNRKEQEPALCMGQVDGFHYTDVMAGSRMEVIAMVKQKLKDNIDFLLNCWNDIPKPKTSDNPPNEELIKGATYIFISLAEIGILAEMLTPLIS